MCTQEGEDQEGKVVRYQTLNHNKRLGWLGVFVAEAGKTSKARGGWGLGVGGRGLGSRLGVGVQQAEVWGPVPDKQRATAVLNSRIPPLLST